MAINKKHYVYLVNGVNNKYIFKTSELFSPVHSIARIAKPGQNIPNVI